MDWRKSSFSNANGGNCLEAASGIGLVMVRDTTNREGDALTFRASAWEEFVTGLRG
jgi:Domain of unknown function (DUF397)